MFFAGLDLGSTTTKAVIIDKDNNIAGYHILLSGNDYRKISRLVLEKATDKAKVNLKSISHIITTGYGRHIAESSTKAVTEISCCARGASFLYPNTRIIIDIGGQDCKAIKIDKTRHVEDFAVSDKCAAGTGRFLERIAVSLGLSLEEMVSSALNSPNKLPISSTCTVFAETEIISRISNGEPIAGILRGLHYALASRVSSLATRLGVEPEIFLCGGGAMNAALVKELKEMLGKIVLLDTMIDPRLISALGAALFAKTLSLTKQPQA